MCLISPKLTKEPSDIRTTPEMLPLLPTLIKHHLRKQNYSGVFKYDSNQAIHQCWSTKLYRYQQTKQWIIAIGKVIIPPTL